MTLDQIARRANEWSPANFRGRYESKAVLFPNGLYAICPPDGWMGLNWIEMAHGYPSVVVLALTRDRTAVDRMEIKL